MSSEWKEVKLGEVCEIKYGKDHKKLDDGKIPVYGSGGIMRYVDTAIHSKKSVLIPRKGTLTNLFFVKPPFWTVDTIFWTDIAIEKIQPEYLYYILQTKDLASYNVGTAVPSLTTKVLNEIEISLPPLPEQKAIADTLSCLDDKIELNNKINKTLEEMAQAIFKSWFVDFEPFQDGEFVDSELGRIPKGWGVGSIDNIAEITSGKRPQYKQNEKNANALIPLVGASSIMGYTNEILYNEKILVTGRVGTHGIVQRFNIPCWTSDNTLVIKSLYYEYIYQILLSVDYKNMNRGSTQPLITQTDLKNVSIIIPPQEIFSKYEDLVGILMKRYEENKIEIQTLTTLRDTLLPKLMSGEIRVPYDEN